MRPEGYRAFMQLLGQYWLVLLTAISRCDLRFRQLDTQPSLTIDELLDFLPNAFVFHPIAFNRLAAHGSHLLP
jgi:hypothetical protein